LIEPFSFGVSTRTRGLATRADASVTVFAGAAGVAISALGVAGVPSAAGVAALVVPLALAVAVFSAGGVGKK